MHCPFCRHDDTQVVETRVSDDGDVVRRRRRCPACDKRFTTYERAEIALPSVVKKDGSRTDFDRRKIVACMKLALRKRPVAASRSTRRSRASRTSCSTAANAKCAATRLGELVMHELAQLDKVAYVRFASVYSASRTYPNSKTCSMNSGAPRRRSRLPASAERFCISFPRALNASTGQSVEVFARPVVGHSADGGDANFSLD